MDSSPLRLGIIISSVRRSRKGEGIAKWFHGLAAAREPLAPVLLDLMDYRLPDFEAPTGARMAEKDYEQDAQRRWVAAVAALDAFAVVVPEYNYGYPASLKNALDHVWTGWRGKPMGFVSYGGISGGTRCVQQLRQVAIGLACVPLQEEVNIPLVFETLDDQGAPRDPYYASRAGALLDALLWWGRALRDARAREPLPPPPQPILPRRAAG